MAGRKMVDILPGAHELLRDFAAFAGRRLFVAALLMALGAAFDGISLVLIIPFLDIVLGARGAPHSLQTLAANLFHATGTTTPFARLALLISVFAVLMILRGIVLSARDIALSRLRIGFVESRRARIAECLATARWEQVARLRHSRITHAMSGDIQHIGSSINSAMQAVAAAATLFVQLALAIALAPALGLIALALLAVSAAIVIPALHRARSLGHFMTDRNLKLLDATSQFLGGMKLAFSQNLQASFTTEFGDTLRALGERQVAYLRQRTNLRLVLGTLSAFIGAALVLLGFGVLHISAPILIALLLIISRMNGPTMLIQQGAQQLAHALPAYAEIKQLELDLAELARQASPAPGRHAFPEGAITFDNVSFRHETDGSDAGGVHALCMRIEPGTFVGISGPSGAGKTTFADLLIGLFPPQEGQILIGGTALDESALGSWRQQTSYVPQDPFLFHDTIRRNLSWANPSASETEMWGALAAAGADALVGRMAHGLDTIAGERGTRLSGGERQRIALARAIVRRPRLLVLDEATSAIDITAEQRILENLRALPQRPTIVMIAHRSESLSCCDRVLHMGAGRISEPGWLPGSERH